MKKYVKFTIICIILSVFCIASASANDNITDDNDFLQAIETPAISVNTTEVYTGDSIAIYLKDSNNSGIANQNLTANIKSENYLLTTNDVGEASFRLNFTANKYTLNVIFKGSQNYAPVNQTFNVNVLKLPTTITPVNTTVLKYQYFYTYLNDSYGNPLSGVNVSFTVNGKSYDATADENGKARFKVSLTPDEVYSLNINFAGNEYYEAISKNVMLCVPATTTLVIGNNKLLSNGYLRVYLKSTAKSAISNKKIRITIGSKSYNKTTNSEGIVIFKPKLNEGSYYITASYGGSSTAFGCADNKTVNCSVGDVKNPLKTKVPLVNGVPDIDVMPGNYVMADENFTYSLLKTQYKEVMQRDSHTLYLKNKLSKYVFFKTKTESSLNHIIVREKWNVIERAINTKIVLKNKYNYWPGSITVSLKGKSYTYSQVRDVQDTGYTCGPTSDSMCTQFLKSYVNEKQLAKMAGSNYYSGSTTKGLKKALEKYNFKCSIYYKSSFTKAINELKKGGRALVFHTWNHYVAILDISADGKKVLVGNPSGDYDTGSHSIPTNWLTVSYMKKMFNNYDTSGLIVKLKYSLSTSKKTQLRNLYSSMGTGWVAQNTNERIPQI